MKLLAEQGNTKQDKTAKDSGALYATLSMMPDPLICPGSKPAKCRVPCLESSGRGAMSNVANARQAKTDYWHSDREAFLEQLNLELTKLWAKAKKQKRKLVVRLNTISDIAWEEYGIPQAFPMVEFLDYTKRAKRLFNADMPSNYRLIFSYSGVESYAKQVELALKSDRPIAVVFRNYFPKTFLGRPVINGDKSDIINVNAGPVIVGLVAKGKAKNDYSGFVVDIDSNIIGVA